MTLLVSWVGIDTHGTSSMYITSDSRISWPGDAHFDLGRKVFAFSKWPDILGYCGDVLFPSIALNQIVQLADAGLLFRDEYTCQQKFQAIVGKLNHLFNDYPAFQAGLADNSLNILHASRDGSDNKQFLCQSIVWSQKFGWKGSQIDLPHQSDVLFVLGSAASEFQENYKRYQAGPNKRTSRSVFHCFCDTLENAKDPNIGGAPQVVGLYRMPDSAGINFGVIYRKSRYFLGARIDNLKDLAPNVDWRNNNFERCNGRTMKKLESAQPQPDPLRRL